MHILRFYLAGAVLLLLFTGHTPSGRSGRKDWFLLFCITIKSIILLYVLNISVIQCVHFKKQLNVGSWWDRGRFMKNFRFNTICNITQEPQQLQRYNRACRFIGKSAVIKCHQLFQVLHNVAGNRFSTS